MKNFKRIFLVLLTAFSFSSATQAQSKAEIQVAARVEELRKAMIDPTKEKFDNLVLDELSYGHSGGKIEDKAAFTDAFLSGKSDFVTIDLTDQTIKIHKKTAIVRHTLSATTNDNNKPGTVKLMIMTVWEKDGGRWKLLARQAVKFPV